MRGNRSHFSSFFRLAAQFRRLRPFAIRTVCKREGGQMWSPTFRELMSEYYGIKIGKYSYGPVLRPGAVPEGTRIGAYCSIASGVCIFRRNHPYRRIALHPFFYNSSVGILPEDSIESDRDNPLEIEADAWIGANSIFTPRCKRVGMGAVVAAGAIVTEDVPKFALVAGNPAKVIGVRFAPEVQDLILESRWWDYPIESLSPLLDVFLNDATPENAKLLILHLKTQAPFEKIGTKTQLPK